MYGVARLRWPVRRFLSSKSGVKDVESFKGPLCGTTALGEKPPALVTPAMPATPYVPKPGKYDRGETSRKRWRVFKASLLGIGLTYTLGFAYMFRETINQLGNPADIENPGTLYLLRAVFGKGRSHIHGYFAGVQIPVHLRSLIYSAFGRVYGVNFSEIRYPVDTYKTFQEFFSRSLAAGARPMATTHSMDLVSPCDGKVLAVGTLDSSSNRIEQVKGATYNVQSFIGRSPSEAQIGGVPGSGSTMRYCVLYLAPGDYHRFHSPGKVSFSGGMHFPGELLPVAPWLVSRFGDVFTANERVVLSGTWPQGKFHFGAVAAYGVGDIWLSFDDKLRTGNTHDIPWYRGGPVKSKRLNTSLTHGELLGGFKMGSTIVLIFEAAESGMGWAVKKGDTVKVGDSLFVRSSSGR